MSGIDLCNASGYGDLTKVERLLDAGVDVNWKHPTVWNLTYHSVINTVEIVITAIHYSMETLL